MIRSKNGYYRRPSIELLSFLARETRQKAFFFCASSVLRCIHSELYTVYQYLGELLLQGAQRVAPVANGVFLLLRHLGEAFVSFEFIGKKQRVIPKAALT